MPWKWVRIMKGLMLERQRRADTTMKLKIRRVITQDNRQAALMPVEAINEQTLEGVITPK